MTRAMMVGRAWAVVMAAALSVPLPLAAGSAATAAAPREGLLAEYVFQQTSGTAVPNAAGGSSVGGAIVVNGRDSDWTGTSLRMRGGAKDGDGDWVELPDDLLLGAESATITADVKASSATLGGFHFLWNIGNDTTDSYVFSSLNCAGRAPLVGIKSGADDQTVQASSCGIEADTWVNVASVIDGDAGTASLYLDGELVATGDVDHTPADVAEQSLNTIGRAPWPDPLFEGEIASFRVYDRALTAKEIATVAAADAAINAADLLADAQAVLNGLDVTDVDTNSHIDLPAAGGRVSWESSDPHVVTADGTVTCPADGRPPSTATLTATMEVRGQVATRSITVTVRPSDETPVERLARLTGRWVVPNVLASGTDLPAAPPGVSVTDIAVTDGDVLLDNGAIVSKVSTAVHATVTATIADDHSSETLVRSFDVTVLPAGGSRAVLVYDRVPTSSAEANNVDVAASMHLALDDGAGWAPLYDNYGIFFANTSEEPGPFGTNSDIIRSLVDPHLFYLGNGDFGIVATRVARGGGSDGTQASSILYARSSDLLSYEEIGLVDVGVTNGVNDPAAVYDSDAGHYVVTWRSDTGAQMYTTFTDLGDDATRGEIERGTVQIVGDGADGAGVDDFGSGNSLPVMPETAEALNVRFGPIVNTGARALEGVDVTAGEPFAAADLPQRIDLDYSDGSTGSLAIEWDADTITAVDTSAPGEFIVDGSVRQTVYATPFADERADPSVFKLDWNGVTKFLMIATKDLNLDPINNSGQPTGMPLRVADTIEDLSDEALEAGRNQEVDLLVNGSLDADGGVMTGCFWAPELHMIGGTLSILFMPCYGENPDMWTGRASIIQLKKDGEGHHLDPANPASWTAAEHVVRADGSILNDLAGISLDMTYFEDSDRSYYAWQMLGSIFIATMDPANPTRLTSDPVRILAPEYAWDNTIAEGPNVHLRDGKLFMLYSGSTVGDTYTTGLATATAGQGGDLTEPASWTRLNYPIQKSGPYNGEMQLGTGHGMWSEDEDDNLLYVFHARTNNKGLTGRDMFVRRVHWASDGMPVLDMETDEELLPELRDVSIPVRIVEPEDE